MSKEDKELIWSFAVLTWLSLATSVIVYMITLNEDLAHGMFLGFEVAWVIAAVTSKAQR